MPAASPFTLEVSMSELVEICSHGTALPLVTQECSRVEARGAAVRDRSGHGSECDMAGSGSVEFLTPQGLGYTADERESVQRVLILGEHTWAPRTLRRILMSPNSLVVMLSCRDPCHETWGAMAVPSRRDKALIAWLDSGWANPDGTRPLRGPACALPGRATRASDG